MLNLSASIAFHARQTPDRTAVIYRDRPISYGEFYTRIHCLAALMHARGIKPGDVVALFMKNSPAFLEIAYAASYVGAVFLPVNYRLAAAEADYILNDAQARLLFVDQEFTEIVALDIPSVVLDDAAQADSRLLFTQDMPIPDVCVRQEQDLVRLMYTSGTTARPKGVMHTYGNIHWKCIDHIIVLGLSREERLMIVGPLYHVGAFDLPGIAVLSMGGLFCLHRDFDAGRALASIERYKLTSAWMAPVMVSRILSFEQASNFDVSSFRWVIAGGEKTPESRIRDFTRVFKAGRFIDAYGMTETCSGDTLMEAGKEFEKIGSTGRATPHVELCIMDEAGRVLPPNTQGEICMRGPKVTKGYWNAPDKTAETFFVDWLRSGDVGYLDEDGFLFLTDRVKDMIVTGAENVASSEVEAVLYKMPQVMEAAVIGAPDERWGERIVAVIVLQPESSLTFEELELHCAKYLARFKIPKELRLVEALPRNPSGKVLKRTLRQAAG